MRILAQSSIQRGDILLNPLSAGNLVIPKAFTLGKMPPCRADEMLTPEEIYLTANKRLDGFV